MPLSDEQMKKAIRSLWDELPPSGTCVDFDKLNELFSKHFPCAKDGAIDAAAIRAEAGEPTPGP